MASASDIGTAVEHARYEACLKGLALSFEGDRGRGVVAGRTVTCDLSEGRGRPVPFVGFQAPFVRRLDLGLRVVLRPFAGVVEEEDPFEAEFTLGGDEPGRARELLEPAVREQLAALHATGLVVAVSDAGPRIEWPETSFEDPVGLSAALHALVRLSATMEVSARALRPSVRLSGHAEALAHFANEHGFEFATTPLGLEGELAGCAFTVRSQRVGWHSHCLAWEVRLMRPLATVLDVRRQRLLDTLPTQLGTADFVLGSAEFDRRFRVEAAVEARAEVARLFEPALIELLVDLDREIGATRLNRDRIGVEALANEVRPLALVSTLKRLVRAAVLIDKNDSESVAGFQLA